MTKFLALAFTAFGLAALQSVMTASVAEAKIVCRDGFQVSGGREISTPYCNDALVAAVARERGFKVSDAEVRNKPSKKNEICRWVGGDIRINHYCPDDHSDSPDR